MDMGSRCMTITETQANLMPLQTADKCAGDSSVRDDEMVSASFRTSKESWEDECGNSASHRVVDRKYFQDKPTQKANVIDDDSQLDRKKKEIQNYVDQPTERKKIEPKPV